MTDITTINTLLSSIKTATEIAKFIKDADTSIEGAEFKLKMAELMGALADVKIELADVQDELIERDKKITQLQLDLLKKSETKFDGSIYWTSGDKTPFCTVCLERDSQYHHLTHQNAGKRHAERWWCKVCKNVYYI